MNMNKPNTTLFNVKLECNTNIPIMDIKNDPYIAQLCESENNVINCLQLYNPLYSVIKDVSYNVDNRSLNHKYNLHTQDKIYRLEDGIEKCIETPVFIKYSPLLDPLHYMIGKYDNEKSILRNLPNEDNM